MIARPFVLKSGLNVTLNQYLRSFNYRFNGLLCFLNNK